MKLTLKPGLIRPLETFKKHFGPTYYAFEYGQALFVVMDNIYYKGSGEANRDDLRQNGGYENRLTKNQLAWLENELEFVDPDRLVFLATHSPLGSENGPDSFNTVNRDKLFRLLKDRPNLYSVAGHTHTTNHVYLTKTMDLRGRGRFIIMC